MLFKLEFNPRALPGLSALSQEDRDQVLDALRALQETPIAVWHKDHFVQLPSDKDVYAHRLPSGLWFLVRVVGRDTLELLDLVRDEALNLFRSKRPPVGVAG